MWAIFVSVLAGIETLVLAKLFWKRIMFQSQKHANTFNKYLWQTPVSKCRPSYCLVSIKHLKHWKHCCSIMTNDMRGRGQFFPQAGNLLFLHLTNVSLFTITSAMNIYSTWLVQMLDPAHPGLVAKTGMSALTVAIAAFLWGHALICPKVSW